MKNTNVFASIVVAVACYGVSSAAEPADQLPLPPEGKAWKLVWQDEFNGTQLDESKWECPQYKRRDGYWKREGIALDGKGNLLLRVFEDDGKFIDGCARTRGKFEHAFGYFVGRMKFQKQPGHWSAFWLFHPTVNKTDDEGRNGTEIDIVEKFSLDEQCQHAMHWDGYGEHHKSSHKKFEVPGIMDGYHTFAVWWTPEQYVFYVDGKETWRTKDGGVCQVPLFIKLSDEIGSWAGDIRKAKLPDAALVDYVRVYDLVEKP